MKRIVPVVSLLLLSSLSFSCKKSEEEKPTGTLQMSMRLAASDSTGALALDASPSDFRATAIVSGPPDEMKLVIKKMSLISSSGSDQITIYSNSEGKELVVKSGNIDLSSLFTRYACLDNAGNPVEGVECPCGLDSDNKPVEKDEAGSCKYPEGYVPPSGLMEVQEGTFGSLRVEFGIGAKMKGCVTGNYSTMNNPVVQGVHTYCTNSAKSTLQATQGGTNADFEIAPSSATEMLVQLGGEEPMPTSDSRTYGLNFPIKGNIEIKEGQTADLTMVLDANRLLRFYNQNTPTQGPSPGSPLNTSYFFTGQVFDNSVFVFVGKPGEIRGFQTWTSACNTTPKPADRICTGAGSVVTGWVTVVKDPDAKPLLLGLNPDDDNTLTIIKGSNKSENGIDPTAFVANGSNYDMVYKLGNEGGGTIYNINLDAAVGSTQTSTFECKIQTNDYYGKIYLKRLL